MAENFSNNTQTTLSGPITAGATTLAVASATGFPAAPFRIAVAVVAAGAVGPVATNIEIMLVTLVSGTTFTVTRGTDGTTGLSHASGEVVAQIVTNLSLLDLPYLAQGGLVVTSNVLDTVAAGTLSLGTVTATAIALGQSGVTTTITGALTQLTGAVSLTANAASSFTTSAGALTLTAAAASTWSTAAGALTLTSAAAATWSTAAGALTISSAAALNLNAASASVIAFQVNAASIMTLSANTLSLAVAATSYTISQVAASSGAGNNLTIAPQAPTTTGAAGSLVVNVAAPASGTVQAGIMLALAGTVTASLQPVVSTSTSGALYLGTAAAAPTATNYAIESTGTATIVGGSSSVELAVAGTSYLLCSGNIVQMNKVVGNTSGSPFAWNPITGIALSNTTATLSSGQLAAPALNFTGTLTGAVTVAIGGKIGFWLMDFSTVVLGAFGVTITNGAGSCTATTLIASKQGATGGGGLIVVNCYSASTVAIG